MINVNIRKTEHKITHFDKPKERVDTPIIKSNTAVLLNKFGFCMVKDKTFFNI